ncbi:hypothetical protein EhV075 [Emiliania huxleyi virus 86]|uniref:Putative membrane protein n=2 Tax=Emiliania huxleyi virus 86 TaxID=181082 RepID=Q4A358_EHV8U|nr:hypothetical protein EhV075 [Emiliania huxleyi virus 86]AEO97887.1 hypothetical protein ENVG_00192 [Emiliania huxleyi virus 84]AEP15014.1 hypothetical protein EOVG_00077 [Emiliania huxleyi virus 88]AHA54645.1 putative membrane protein [Emiliania huxleyi virus 145]AHA55679.1 putative membrane protein [Emiliania huxleyi virus 164]CAI65498.1 putative membrane protein [Emiliania huxleyi virus 86]
MSIFFIILIALAAMFAVYLLGGYLNIRDKRADNEIYIQQISPHLTVEPGAGHVQPIEPEKFVLTPKAYGEQFQMPNAEQASRARASVIKLEALRQRLASSARGSERESHKYYTSADGWHA